MKIMRIILDDSVLSSLMSFPSGDESCVDFPLFSFQFYPNWYVADQVGFWKSDNSGFFCPMG